MTPDILLINPSSEDYNKTALDNRFKKLSTFNSLVSAPPLGLLYIGTYCKQKGYSVKIIDMDPQKIDLKNIKGHIKKIKPKIVGIAYMHAYMPNIIKLSNTIKEVKNIPIVLGGSNVELFYKQILKEPSIDYVIYGDGEISTKQLLDYIIRNKGKLKNISGLIYKTRSNIIRNKGPAIIENLDSIPFPDRDLIDNRLYFNVLADYNPTMSIITSRGCSYKCKICRPSFRILRRRSPANVINEIKFIGNNFKKYDIEFWDETFNLPKKWVIEFCEEVIKNDITIRWRARCRSDLVDERLIKKMKEAGCYLISLGIESVNRGMLDFFNKGFNVKDVIDVIEIIKKNNIYVHGYFIIGSPTETKKEMLNTISFAKDSKLDYATFSILHPTPGTELSKIALVKNWIKDPGIVKDIKKFNSFIGTNNFLLKHPELSTKDIKNLYFIAHLKFYLSMPRLFNILLRLLKYISYRFKLLLLLKLS